MIGLCLVAVMMMMMLEPEELGYHQYHLGPVTYNIHNLICS